MPVGQSRLSLASPTDVALALADFGRYHYGLPDEGLIALPYEGYVGLPHFEATEPLKKGDVYVDDLFSVVAKIIDGVEEQSIATKAIKAAMGAKKVARVLALIGYIPVKVTIPTLGGTMTYSPHGRLVFKGHFGPTAGSESDIFTFSLNYDVVGPDVGAMPTTLPGAALDAILARWKTFWGSSMSGTSVPGGGSLPIFTNQTWLDEVAYAKIGTNGKTVDGQYQRAFSTPVAGAGGDNSQQVTRKPLQVATAVTLDAQGPRGGRFGRFYLPHLAVAVSDGVYQWGMPQTITAVQTVLADTNAALSGVIEGDVELIVASARGAGENRPVRQVRVGNVPDTIRSRRNGLSENYSALPFQSI